MRCPAAGESGTAGPGRTAAAAPCRVGQHGRVLLFLPPSEAKSVDGVLPALRGTFGRDEVGRARRRVLTEVVSLSRRDPNAAAVALKLPAGAAAEATGWNRTLLDSPTTPALLRYTGVVYQSLAASTLTGPQRAAASNVVRIFSGGFGYLAADDPVPAYRVPASARLPDAGGLTSLWKPVLRDVVVDDIGDELVVDLRSGDYAALWLAPAQLREQVLTVRVLTRRRTPNGVTESVVSYNSKHVKGVLARALVQAATRGKVRDVRRVRSIVEATGYEVRSRAGAAGATILEVVEDVAL